ncbi:hypothetical protein VU11_03520 [Desulfobulbus sp. US2]|nr:hypothetical protein [Desulfobulbus sp. US4]MCW5204518.1 hypothetical protein [Desulfobulbus sp. N2]MCW5207729.1 hypothetical protein [Desulfobulbus sp. US2]WLE96940.1 MAG: hypothetical protein QTN59_19975 [Candidatus Electrothrix communis]
MLQFKKLSVNLALAVSLAAFAGSNSAQAENINIPLPTDDPQIQAVVDNVRADVDGKALMRQTRDKIKVEQVKRLPLLRPLGDAISQVVSTRVRQETRDRTRKTQMAAMQDPMNPEGMPNFIAPTFD